MAKRRKDELDEPIVDLGEVSQQARNFYEDNQRLIVGIVAGLALIVLGYFAYVYFIKGPKEKEASAQMHRAEFAFKADSFAVALEDPGGGFLGFIDVADKYSGTKAGNLAHYYAGASFLQLGNFEKAIRYLKRYNANEPMTRAMKNGMLGDAYSEIQNFDKAVSHYKKAASASGDDLTAPIYLQRAGMLLEKLGKNKEALTQYEKIRNDFYSTPQGQTGGIDKYIARVKAKL